MKQFFYFLSASYFLASLTFILVTRGIPFAHAVSGWEDNWGDEYLEPTEWHEIGAPDPRFQDPCGPGIHDGTLGDPGCLSSEFSAFQFPHQRFTGPEKHEWFAARDNTLHHLRNSRAMAKGLRLDKSDNLVLCHDSQIRYHIHIQQLSDFYDMTAPEPPIPDYNVKENESRACAVVAAACLNFGAIALTEQNHVTRALRKGGV